MQNSYNMCEGMPDLVFLQDSHQGDDPNHQGGATTTARKRNTHENQSCADLVVLWTAGQTLL